MSRVRSSDPVPFTLPGGCLCKGSPHAEDIVWFWPSLSIEGGAAAEAVIERARQNGTATFTEEVQREMAWALTYTGIVSWNFLDDDGKPEPCTEKAIRGLKWEETSQYLVDHASTLYADAAFAPFQQRLLTFSRAQRTARSTSARRSSSGSRPTRSRPSSRTTSAASTPSTA